MSRLDDLRDLTTLLDEPGLGEMERDAFAGMQEHLNEEGCERLELSKKRRAWVDNALERFGLDDPVDNSGVPVGKPVRAYEALVAQRPLKPPGRC